MHMTFSQLKDAVGYDPACGADANCQHALHVLEGYRAIVLSSTSDNPYSPGGPRHFSWDVGRKMASADVSL